MKVVQLTTRSDAVGGAQKYILETSGKFKKDGNDVTVIAGGFGTFSEEVRQHGLRYIGLDSIVRKISLLEDFKGVWALRSIIKSIKPDVVVIHSAKAGLIGRLALIGVKTKVIFIAHGWSHIRSSGVLGGFFYGFIEFLLSFFCEKVICISRKDLEFANKNLMISKKRTILIYSGVRDPLVSNEVSFSNDFRFLTVTRFQYPKDFNTLLLAMNNVNKEYKNWSIDVLGEGEELNYFKRKVRDLGLEDKINFLGFKRDLSIYYKKSDLVFLISRSEGLPLSLIEAMSYKKAILASNVGGVSELIDDRVNGYLIPPLDSSALSEAFIEIFKKNKKNLSILGEKSYEKYSDQFRFDKMIKSLYQLFKS